MVPTRAVLRLLPLLALAPLACGAPSETGGQTTDPLVSPVSPVPRDPRWTPQVIAGNVAGNPIAFRTNAGRQGDFALLVPDRDGGLLSYTRANDVSGLPWHGPIKVFDDFGSFDALAAIPSNYGTPGDLQVVTRHGSTLYFAWRDNDPQVPWHGVFPLLSNMRVAGAPSMIQSTFGQQGNFEVVTPLASGGLGHIWRDNDHNMAWNGPITFGGSTPYSAVSLIQTNYGSPGDLALAAVTSSGRLDFYTRPSSPVGNWSPPLTIGSGESGTPVLFQSTFGTKGNFEVFVPSANVGIDEYWRDNDNGGAWHGPYNGATSLGHVDGLSVFQSNYASPGNFELFARVGTSISFAFREGLNAFHPPGLLIDQVDVTTPPPAALTYGYSEYLGPLTAAPINNENKVDLWGVDLGTSFEAADGSLGFLFGDAWTVRQDANDDDSIAFTTATSIDRYSPPKMTWVGGATQFATLDPPNMVAQGMNVPIEGIALNGLNYYFFSRGWFTFCNPAQDGCFGEHTGSELASMNGRNIGTLTVLHDVNSSRFINVSAVPGGDGFIYLFGDGLYRSSAVYVARIPATGAALADMTQWAYFRGLRGGVPVWGPDELTALPLFRAGVPAGPAGQSLIGRPEIGVGELSVRKHPTLPLYLMTYQAPFNPQAPNDVPWPGGVVLRTSTSAWGPWSAPTLILQPSDAYGTFIHAGSDQPGQVDDGLGMDCYVPGAPNGLRTGCPAGGQLTNGGGMYGPYLVPRYFQDMGNVHSIAYTISSWNPYQTHLVRSYLTSDGTVIARPNPGVGYHSSLTNADFSAGTSGWYATGDAFTLYRAGGLNWLNTWTSRGDAAEGTLSQWFWVDDKVKALHFFLHGGHGAVKLLRGGEVVRTTRGRQDNDHNLEVTWSLSDFRGEPLQVEIEDAFSDGWGFITVSGMNFVY